MLVDTQADSNLLFQLLSAAGVPIDPDAAPTYRVYDGNAGLVASGTLERALTGTVSDVTNANPAVVTDAGHDLSDGTVVVIAGVGGATGVNGTRRVTRLTDDTFSVPVAAGGAYTSGGTWYVQGLYKLAVDTPLRTALEPGAAYTVLVDYLVSAANTALPPLRFNAA